MTTHAADRRRASAQFRREEHPEASVILVGYRSAPYLVTCLRSLRVSRPDASFEVIVVLNAPTDALRQELDRDVSGVIRRESSVNIGFGAACNDGARVARGRYLVLLNDDTEVEPGWLDALVDMARSKALIGAVGSRILDRHGALMEAGNLLWSDGSTAHVGAGVSVPGEEYDWARPVDFCSGSSLLVPSAVWNELGGFDGSYFPAYYEDVDLCLRIAGLGLQVWYQPDSVVRHVETGSSSWRFRDHLIERNRGTLLGKWAAELSRRPPRDVSAAAVDAAIWLAMGEPHRVLVIDDFVPDQALGAGFGRMIDTLGQLAADPRLHVAFCPLTATATDPAPLTRLGIRLVSQTLDAHLKTPSIRYDTVIVSRPHNYAAVGRLIRRVAPEARLIYDAEALYFRRIERQSRFAPSPAEAGAFLGAAQTVRLLEERIVRDADLVVTIAEEEADLIRRLRGDDAVRIVPPNLATPVLTPNGYRERSDMILVSGWIGGMESPNADGLVWFLREVFPIVARRVPWARLLVTGVAPPEELRAMESPSLRFVGRVADLAGFYDRARVAIVPIRFGSGVKLKTIEALQHGVPVVSTNVGAEGVVTGEFPAPVVSDDADVFAGAVATLLDDRQAWERSRATLERLNAWWARTVPTAPWLDVVHGDGASTNGGRAR